ncbi:DNA topoisomerase 3-beta-1 [Brachionus plicatilis]|uniref:DNA topoisomerase n=1 Tax=Brachionus plicatilis TaxID=10195 RepID=A0A3M7TAA9_BRAPC|nr:DNA topoisomerase 3-beta-1 [Brachionus plicatilis]
MIVLMVAEKPSLAQSIAKILSNNNMNSRKGFNNACNIHEWSGKFMNYQVRFKMTSVCGHVMSLDFDSKYNNWDKTDPSELFSAETLKKEATPNLKMPAFLEKEARGVDYLVLWLDCDREGENICFEVIDSVNHVLARPGDSRNIFRAHFSSITDQDIKRAMNNLVKPNKNESLSVDARQELDLRIGCAFTRFQTRFFQGKYGDLDCSLVSYGPCQTPTLTFCVDRMDRIKSFKPETFWYLDAELQHAQTGQSFSVKWSRNHLFDKDAVYMFYNDLKQTSSAVVIDVHLQEKSKQRPVALNTVEMLRAASAGLGISPIHAMQIAEKLYTQGYISYPRTETTNYAANFNFKEVLVQQTKSSSWGSIAQDLLNGQMVNPRKGVDQGDHPPITPTSFASPEQLPGDLWRLYEFITKHFLATVSRDCKYEELTVTFRIKNEEFSCCGKNTIENGWTELMPWKQIDFKEIPNLKKGETVQIGHIKVLEKQTNPPDYLTESELIGLMEKNGIGTDASIPVHINNICERNYVKLERDRRLVPTNLGVVLVHGYQRIDPELCLPKMRSQVEEQLNLIALGKANYLDVLKHTLKIFEQKFHFFVQNIPFMDSLFEDSFSSLSATGKPMSRCGKCRRFMKLVLSKPQRLYCEYCKDTYNLPQNGTIKLYRELKCPLDDFELLINSINKNLNHPFCPYCFNNPPFDDMKKGDGCINCSHPTCAHGFTSNALSKCFECQTGLMLFDGTTPPKFRVICNNKLCRLIIILPDTIIKADVSDDLCDQCDTPMLQIVYHKDKTPLQNGQTSVIACLFCDNNLKVSIENYLKQGNKNFNFDSRRKFTHRNKGGGRRKRVMH